MNSYLLLYKEPKHFGRFANFANVNCLALGIHLGVLLFVVAVPLSLLIARLPIGLYGLGTFEGAFVFLLSASGLSGADAVAMSLSARILEILAFLPWWLANLTTAGSIWPLVSKKKYFVPDTRGTRSRGESS